ncbi:MAG: hypothetical protein IIV05_00685, partial [Ruminococcus sp.]|nr:hypothetical protein [Ruminococcus sp.]
MGQNSGFFNAFLRGGVYDRTYNADDYCNNLATIIKSGVTYSSADDLKVTAHSGMTVSVGAGRAWILGHWYYNDTAYTGLTIGTAPSGSNARIDRIVLRLDTSTAARSIVLAVKQGTAAASPVAPALTRSGNVYEICLADVRVNAGAVSISNKNGSIVAEPSTWRLVGDFNGWAPDDDNQIMTYDMEKHCLVKTGA